MRTSYYMIIVALLIFTPITAFSQESEQNEETEKQSKIKTLNSNYTIKKTVSLGEKYSWENTILQITNIGNETAIIQDIQKNQFFVKDESYKLSALSIDPSKIHLKSISLPFTLEPMESRNFTITSDLPSKSAGTFSGKLLILGNFEPTEVGLDVIIKQDPKELMGFTVIGIIIAVITTFMLKIGINYFTNSDQVQKGKSKKKDVKQAVVDSFFQFTLNDARKSKQTVSFREKGGEESGDESDKPPKIGTVLIQIGYSMAVALVAIPTTLFAQGTLTGDPSIDSAIAVGIGAGIFGTKDLVGELKAG